MWLDDLHFQLVPPTEVVTVAKYTTDSGLTWAYNGQAVIPDYFDGAGGYVETVPEYVLTGLEYDPDEYLGVGSTVKVDEYGREWLLVDADLSAVEDALARYDEWVVSVRGELEEVEESEGIEFPEDAGKEVWVDTYSYTPVECNPSNTSEELAIESTSGPLLLAPDPMSGRERKVPLIHIMAGQSNGFCSGVLVDDDTVLTAAHCLAPLGEQAYGAASFRACSRGNYQDEPGCRQATSVQLKCGTWTGFRDCDVGLIHFAAGFGEGSMPMSTASSTLVGENQRLRGYPGFFSAACGVNTASQVNPYFNFAMKMFRSNGECSYVGLGVIEVMAAAGAGMSGGPFYRCPSGDCEVDALVTGLLGGFTGYAMNGAHAGSFRSWVIANM